MSNYNCSVLVLSCDKNISLLNIFFDFFNKNWKDCPFPVFLGMEKKLVQYSGVNTLTSEKNYWADRVLDYFNVIENDYVMLILDDFIPETEVDTQRILNFLEYMKTNEHIATISLADIYDDNNTKTEILGLCKRRKNANYLLNLQVGIWNKSVLMRLMKKTESPWQTELFGSIRARQFSEKEFLCLNSDAESPYKYGRGWLMVRGIWNGNEIKRLGLQKYADDLFDGKDIQYSNLMHIGFLPRIRRRLQIEYRKLLSLFGIYI